MRTIFYYLIFTVVIGAVLVSFWTYQKYFKKENPELLLFSVEKGNIQEVVKIRGEVVPQKDFDLEFPFSGIVEKVLVQEGQEVSADQPLMKLETTDFALQIRKFQAQLAQAEASFESAKAVLNQYKAAAEAQKAKLAEIKLGTRPEEIQAAKTKIANAENSLKDAETNLNNVKEQANAKLQENYDSALTAVQKSVSVGKTALLTLSDVQQAHFNATDQDSVNLAEAKATAVQVLLGGRNAGRWNAKFINELNGGTFETVQNAVINPSYKNIDKALSETINALQKVKQALNAVPMTSILTSTEKTDINAEKNNVNSEIITISDKQQTIATQQTVNTGNIASAEAKVTSANNTLSNAQEDLKVKEAGATAEQIVAQEAQVQQAEANIESQKAQIKQAEANIRNYQAQISIIDEKIRKSTLYAPGPSKIIKVWFEKQELFRPGQIAVSLATSGHKIQADISELEIGKIREVDGNEVLIQFDAFPDLKLKGKIVSVEPKEIIKENDKYYRTNVYVEPHDLSIRSGMNADLVILISSKSGVLKIPELAIYQQDGKKFVTILENNQQKQVEIETGISDGESIEVIKGLSQGQTVVVSAD